MPGIYTASKVIHAPKWREMRAEGWPIVSTWIDEADDGQTDDFEDLWKRCVNEAKFADVLVVYREPDEVLKGAFVEVGAALANSVPVLASGFNDRKDGRFAFSFVHHPLVWVCYGLEDVKSLLRQRGIHPHR